MRILYAVCSEGMGHATRSKTVIDHLKKHHEVKVTAGDRAYTYLLHNQDVHYADGLHLYYWNNKTNILLSIIKNILNLPALIKSFYTTYKLFIEFKPQIVITDYTFLAPWFAKWKKIPCIAISNNYTATYSRIGIGLRYTLGKTFLNIYTRAMTRPNHIINLSYFFPPIKAHMHNQITLCDPVLGEEVTSITPHKKDYILVYQTSSSNNQLINDLSHIDHKFIIYGMNKETVEGNMEFKLFSDDFIQDVANSEAVITNGGFSLISEALYFKKPILSIPVKGQIEQQINAIFIERLGYGKMLMKSSVEDINLFIKNKSHYKLDKYNPDPKQALNVLDKQIKELTL